MSDAQERFHNIHLQVSILFLVLLFSLLCPSFVVNFEPLKFMGYEFSSWRFGENGFLFLGDLDFVLSIVLGQFGLNY